jgi:hypothetical protein
MAVSETSICNMALVRIGTRRITALSDVTPEGQLCNEHYAQVRNSLLRSYWWSFAIDRAALSEDTTSPEFGYDRQFLLPSDCLRMLEIEDDDDCKIEGGKLLTNESSANIVYVKAVTDPTSFDVLFIEVLALALADRLVMAITHDMTLKDTIGRELMMKLSQAKSINHIESKGQEGRYPTWLQSRYASTVENL